MIQDCAQWKIEWKRKKVDKELNKKAKKKDKKEYTMMDAWGSGLEESDD